MFVRQLENIHVQYKYIKAKYEKPKLMVNKTLLSKLSTRWELLNFDFPTFVDITFNPPPKTSSSFQTVSASGKAQTLNKPNNEMKSK